MTVTTQNSTQYAIQTGQPQPTTINEAYNTYSKVRFFEVNFTQSGLGSDGSTARLIKLPAGKVAYLQHLSRLKVSDFGTSRTLDVGWAAYKDRITRAAVVADPDGIHTDAVVSGGASEFSPGDALASGVKAFDSFAGVTITATVDNGSIPDGATIDGIIAIGVE
jgi:hypothetical protein